VVNQLIINYLHYIAAARKIWTQKKGENLPFVNQPNIFAAS
jgi:hypothetical protein